MIITALLAARSFSHAVFLFVEPTSIDTARTIAYISFPVWFLVIFHANRIVISSINRHSSKAWIINAAIRFVFSAIISLFIAYPIAIFWLSEDISDHYKSQELSGLDGRLEKLVGELNQHKEDLRKAEEIKNSYIERRGELHMEMNGLKEDFSCQLTGGEQPFCRKEGKDNEKTYGKAGFGSETIKAITNLKNLNEELKEVWRNITKLTGKSPPGNLDKELKTDLEGRAKATGIPDYTMKTLEYFEGEIQKEKSNESEDRNEIPWLEKNIGITETEIEKIKAAKRARDGGEDEINRSVEKESRQLSLLQKGDQLFAMLKSGSLHVQVEIIGIFLILLWLETLPISMKILSPHGEYEKYLDLFSFLHDQLISLCRKLFDLNLDDPLDDSEGTKGNKHNVLFSFLISLVLAVAVYKIANSHVNTIAAYFFGFFTILETYLGGKK